MTYFYESDNSYDENNIFFIIRYLLRSKSLVDAVINVADSKLKKYVIDRSTINMTSILKLKDVLDLNDVHYNDTLIYDIELIKEYLQTVTNVLSRKFMKYIGNKEPEVMEYLIGMNVTPRVKINMVEFEIEFGGALVAKWHEDEDNYFKLRYEDVLETFK